MGSGSLCGMRIKQNSELPTPVLTVRGDFGDGVADLVATKFARFARHAHQPVLSVRVDLERHADPAVELPVAVAVTVDVNGHPVHATADGRTLRDAVDLVADRVVRRLDDRFRPSRAPRTRR